MRNPPLALTGRTTLDIIRRSEGIRVGGRYQPGEEEIVPVVCNVQPVLKSTDTMLIPESNRSKACLKVYSKGDEIRQLKEGHWQADRFYWKGDLYEVMKVIDYDMGILNHYKAICMRVEDQ
ncbi:hypothetical protein D3C80_526980 [compost metagenome]